MEARNVVDSGPTGAREPRRPTTGGHAGPPATGDMKVPAIYGGVGVRWVFENSGLVRPYAIVTFGAVETELKPTFRLERR